jgi:uncharacterized protein YecT (DUF1311 family)
MIALQIVTLLAASTIHASVPQKAEVRAASQHKPCPTEISGDLSQADLTQCWYRQYKKTDAHLNALYRRLLDSMTKELAVDRRKNDTEITKLDETSLLDLKRTQHVWLRYRHSQCDAAEQQYNGGSAAPMVWEECMVDVTNHRIDELKDAYETPNRRLE